VICIDNFDAFEGGNEYKFRVLQEIALSAVFANVYLVEIILAMKYLSNKKLESTLLGLFKIYF